MRITCVIESLESGGAQRQMCHLASLLKARGHELRVLIYHSCDFYRHVLDEEGIPLERVSHRGKLHRIWAMRNAIRSGRPDVVIAYLESPNILAELAGLPRRDFALIASERSLDLPEIGVPLRRRVALGLHRLADAVVTNSFAQGAVLRTLAPKIARRVVTILNCVDLEQFFPSPGCMPSLAGGMRLLCVGRFSEEKNYLRLLRAVELLGREHPSIGIEVDAYGSNLFVNGRPGPQSGSFLNLQSAIDNSPVRTRFRLHDPIVDVSSLYRVATVLCLPSLFEGCSNVIGEAMACGTPVLASRVGDNSVLVEDGIGGFLFDPASPDEIARAIHRFWELDEKQRETMGLAARVRAENLLAPVRFADQYEQLINQVRQDMTGESF